MSEYYFVWLSAQCKTNVKAGFNQMWMLVVVTFSARQMDLLVVPGWLNLPRYLTIAVMGALTVYCVICTACRSYLQGSRCSGHLGPWGWERYPVPKHQLQTNLFCATVSQGIYFQQGQDLFLKPLDWHWGPPVLYEMDARKIFPVDKAVLAWGWSLNLHFLQSLRMSGSMVCFLCVPPWQAQGERAVPSSYFRDVHTFSVSSLSVS